MGREKINDMAVRETCIYRFGRLGTVAEAVPIVGERLHVAFFREVRANFKKIGAIAMK